MSKETIKSKDYEDILRFISLIQQEKGDFRRKVLKCLSDIFAYNHMTFLLVDENGMFTDPFSLDISRELCRLYTQYYFKTDIFHPINLPNQFMKSQKAISISDIMTYRQFESTDYYNEFLKKDNLYYEIAIPLVADDALIGGVGIFKTKDEGDFRQKDMEILSCLSNYIAFYLGQYQDNSQLKSENFMYKSCIDQMPIGMVVLDSNRKIVSYNESAELFCLDMLNYKSNTEPVGEIINTVLSNLEPGRINSGSSIYAKLEKYTFKISLTIVPDSRKGLETYYRVYIIRDPSQENSKLSYLLSDYKLTQREIEIIDLISKGMSNREISEKLYISVNTVRTHIDNIFSKLDVNNRVGILNKVRS